MLFNITVAINYCSNDKRFIYKNILECKKFADEIIVPVCSKFFNGEDEDPLALQELKEFGKKHSVKIIVFELPENFKTNPLGQRFGHNLARHEAIMNAKHNWVLFLDADEIPEGDRVNEFLDVFFDSLDSHIAYTFSNYWYFREPIYQAKTWEDSIVLCNIDNMSHSSILNEVMERAAIAKNRKYKHGFLGLDEKPLFHHFSWVRTKEEMIKKVTTWGHYNDKDWTALVEEEFSRSFNGTDFVHNYSYIEVENIFNL